MPLKKRAGKPNKAVECSGPHDCHDCTKCLGEELCVGWTQYELRLMTYSTSLRCKLLDLGLTHKQIDEAVPRPITDCSCGS